MMMVVLLHMIIMIKNYLTAFGKTIGDRMGTLDIEEGEIVCPKCGNFKFDKLWIDPLGFSCEVCGFDSHNHIDKKIMEIIQ